MCGSYSYMTKLSWQVQNQLDWSIKNHKDEIEKKKIRLEK